MNYLLTLFIENDEAPRTVANLLYIAVGSLSAVIVYLFISHKQDLKESQNKLDLLKDKAAEQDKETIKVLAELTNFLKDQQESHREIKVGVNQIDKTTTDSNKTLNTVAVAIQEKLLKM